jgi:hypothetical protein
MKTKGATSLIVIKLKDIISRYNPEDEILIGRKFFEGQPIGKSHVKMRHNVVTAKGDTQSLAPKKRGRKPKTIQNALPPAPPTPEEKVQININW